MPLVKQRVVQRIRTGDGVLLPLYKDWEEWNNGYQPKMVYATTINPGVTKGPILHERRRGLITAIQGEVKIEMKIDGKVHYGMLCGPGGRDNVQVEIPAGIPFTLTNLDDMNPAIIINIPDKAWHPDDEDTIKFDSWEAVP